MQPDPLAERIATKLPTPQQLAVMLESPAELGPGIRSEAAALIREQAGRIAELEAKVDELEVTLDDEEASGSETVTLWKQAESERDALRLKVDALEKGLLQTQTMTSQFGTPCWCRTGAMLYCVGQPQCRSASDLLTPATPQGGEGAKLTQWWRCRFCQMKKHRDNCPTRFGIIECPTCLPKGYCSTLEPLPD